MASGRRGASGPKKGELYELSQDLNSLNSSVRKSALKRTITAMTLGKDVSPLFTSVLKLLSHSSLPLKKLVYLYLVHHCSSQQQLAILAVNEFLKDTADPSPLIRALAIRTIAAINVETITQYALDPLHRAMKDPDPYVRKTAAVAVAKIARYAPAVIAEEGFIKELQELLADGSPIVVSNAVAALSEIGIEYLELNSSAVSKYLAILAECTEWGQVFILDALSSYTPTDEEEAETIIERIIPRLQHANAGVVLSTVRLILMLIPRISEEEKIPLLERKMSAPLVSLVNAQPELQYVALKTIALIVERRSSILVSHIKSFYISYADPFYVKKEKLRVLVKLTTEENVREVLAELKEYSVEVDVAFVNLAVEAIGDIGNTLPSSAAACVSLLKGFLNKRNPSLVESSVVSLSRILRRYPGQFVEAVRSVCAVSDLLGTPASRAALVWLVGEYSSEISNAHEMIATFLSTMSDEAPQVQQQILVSAMKCNLALNGASGDTLKNAIDFCLESVNVDLRDRAITYQRLAKHGEEGKRIVAGKRPPISINRGIQEPLLSQLLGSLGTIAAVEYRPLAQFMATRVQPSETANDREVSKDLLTLGEEKGPPLFEELAMVPSTPSVQERQPTSSSVLGELFEDTTSSRRSQAPGGGLPTDGSKLIKEREAANDSLLSFGLTGDVSPVKAVESQQADRSDLKELLSDMDGRGVVIRGNLTQNSVGEMSFRLLVENHGSADLAGFAIQFDQNTFGLTNVEKLNISEPIKPRGYAESSVKLGTGGITDPRKKTLIRIAIKCTPIGVLYFAEDMGDNLDTLLLQNGQMDKREFLKAWAQVPDSQEHVRVITISANLSVDGAISRLARVRLFLVAKRKQRKETILYLSARAVSKNRICFLCELVLSSTTASCNAKLASRLVGLVDGKPLLDSLATLVERVLSDKIS